MEVVAGVKEEDVHDKSKTPRCKTTPRIDRHRLPVVDGSAVGIVVEVAAGAEGCCIVTDKVMVIVIQLSLDLSGRSARA